MYRVNIGSVERCSVEIVHDTPQHQIDNLKDLEVIWLNDSEHPLSKASHWGELLALVDAHGYDCVSMADGLCMIMGGLTLDNEWMEGVQGRSLFLLGTRGKGYLSDEKEGVDVAFHLMCNEGGVCYLGCVAFYNPDLSEVVTCHGDSWKDRGLLIVKKK